MFGAEGGLASLHCLVTSLLGQGFKALMQKKDSPSPVRIILAATGPKRDLVREQLRKKSTDQLSPKRRNTRLNWTIIQG